MHHYAGTVITFQHGKLLHLLLRIMSLCRTTLELGGKVQYAIPSFPVFIMALLFILETVLIWSEAIRI